MAFKSIDPKNISENMFKKIGDDWMLITAGDREKLNTMTASWGCTGILWGKPVAVCFMRPQRYTHDFMDAQEQYTLSFYRIRYNSFCNSAGQTFHNRSFSYSRFAYQTRIVFCSAA